MRALMSALALMVLLAPRGNAAHIEMRDARTQFSFSQPKVCPSSCTSSSQPSNWTVYHDPQQLSLCQQPILFDFAVYNPIDDPNTDITIRACAVGDDDVSAGSIASIPLATLHSGRFSKRDISVSGCGKAIKSLQTLHSASWGSRDSRRDADVVTASQHVMRYLSEDRSCATDIIFGYLQGVLVGVYAGAKLGNGGASSSVLQTFIDHVQEEGIANSTLAQLCGDGRDSDNIFGVVANINGDFAFVQQAVKSWSGAKCVEGAERTQEWAQVPVWSEPLLKSANESLSFLHARKFAHGHSHNFAHGGPRLNPRADCRTVTVVSGDSCGSLATKCGISGATFTTYNPSSSFCSTLQPGQLACCSEGTVPDRRPSPNPDGSCAAYNVKSGDYCQLIASSNGLTVEALNSFNGKTWGWTGCENLQVGIRICLSSGAPPMPAPVPNAVCGPTKPGTLPPTGTIQLADLNPCPLKTCCNIWGQCGTTEDFCIASKSTTGAPGTAAPGTNGCVQNCGMDIINDKEPPASFLSIGYFEAWSGERPCLHMDVSDIDTSRYTHVHYSFAEITPSFAVDISKVVSQFESFKSLVGIKRILAFGGWTFSTEPSTYNIFRQAVNSQNRNTFAENCVNFLRLHNLDGLDFDWEYPGAPDIPGIPPGNPEDGENYLAFLRLLRSKLPAEKSLSIAAPASFWYLKAYPIEDIAKTVNYIVYMTYDLHGQWDYGNQWSSSGCPSGNCLRSHVNMTETMNALAMITRAGVPSKQVVIGVTSYGRSFKMTDPTCRGPMCKFEGVLSGAEPGECTRTAGYLANAEILEIIDQGGQIQTWSDDTQSDYLVYHSTQWVSYMSESNKAARTNNYKLRNFGGTSDWAVDLQEFSYDWDEEDDHEDVAVVWDDEVLIVPDCTDSFATLDAIANAAGKIPNRCGPLYILRVLRDTLNGALKNYQAIIDDGYDEKFEFYATVAIPAARTSVYDFYMAHGESYFTCDVMEEKRCCGPCWIAYGNPLGGNKDDSPCRYCVINNSLCRYQTQNTNLGYESVNEPCPPNYSRRGVSDNPSIYWTMRQDQKAKFFSHLLDETGIAESSIIFGNTSVKMVPDNCYSFESCSRFGWHFGAPKLSPKYSAKDLANPKDLIGIALAEMKNLPASINTIIAEIEGKSYNGDTADLVDALGLPILMVEQSIESMREVAKIGAEIREQEKKTLIVLLITAILFIFPFFGSALGTVTGLASFGRVMHLISELGFVAIDIYDVVQNPSNAPFFLFGLMTRGGLSDLSKIAKGAAARRAMSSADLKKLGGGIELKIAKMDSVTKLCRRK